ncbi:tRNA (guanine37-N1)-methyltransferase [Methanococcus maripaludis]|uniref:tRNA (guanine(37)-N(1))-methyltransferase n=1 Tax=Methanococcus maripaludis TaxID=39152 RepID=A0A7J9NWH1_METMI|nr:class I SAM-dependent methyltransferase family protein [Methanococcus maripaludis]MBA2851363.1 tRNA (guanine37-N1)-methyltransferase [Methanococcus maripaludis]
MIFCIKVNFKLGEKTRKIMLDNHLLSKNYKLKKEGEFLYIPLTSSNFDKKIFEDENIDFEISELDENEISKINSEKKTSFKDYLLKNFKDEVEGNSIAHAYDIVGDIVILQISEKITPEIRKKIGENALKLIPSVKAVFRRESDVKGDFRVRDLEQLAGEEKTLTLYKENGYRLLVDVAKVYFSPRLGWERKRIMDLVTFDDIVVDMFCGVGPYSIACKNAEKIYSIDINPDGIELLKQNIVLNNLENKIVPILEDVRNVDVKGTRVIMNLPKYAHQFVDKALEIVEDGGTIHYYTVGADFDEGIELFKSKCECEILDKRIVKSYSPREYVFVIDFKILKKN